jgi:hypothetical protein
VDTIFYNEKLTLRACLPSSLRKFSVLWSLLCSVTLWRIWIERNDLVFNDIKWHDFKLNSLIREDLLDDGRIMWIENENFLRCLIGFGACIKPFVHGMAKK